MKFYDFPEVYDLFYNDDFESECLNFYKNLFFEEEIPGCD
jgi:hypothetical protein